MQPITPLMRLVEPTGPLQNSDIFLYQLHFSLVFHGFTPTTDTYL